VELDDRDVISPPAVEELWPLTVEVVGLLVTCEEPAPDVLDCPPIKDELVLDAE
jgi:hypothetical protein